MLFQQVLSGLSTGAIYALLGLALVVVFQATRHLNLAQGEMAMFSTFIAWQLLAWGVPYWPAFLLTVVVSFGCGCLLQRLVMHPFRTASPLAQVGAMVGLILILNSLAGAIWNHEIKGFPSPFGEGPAFGSSLISAHRAGMIAVCIALVVGLSLFLRRSSSGLFFRAAAENVVSARLAGIRVDRFVMLGWDCRRRSARWPGCSLRPSCSSSPT